MVPYNPYLTKELKCHINVEFRGSIRAVKYLYKYTYKGHDRAEAEFELDEIKRYLDTRYVGPPEACWRLLGFELCGRSHVIERLGVHLPHSKRVLFSPGEEAQALNRADTVKSTLEAWYALNIADEAARSLRYAEIPEHYRWMKQTGTWLPRSKTAQGARAAERVIGRIHGAQPSEGDRFYLYMMLLHLPGITSDEELRTVNGTLYSYREAAERRGLLTGDMEYEFALQEAAELRSPPQLRTLFAHLLLHCEGVRGADLWERFKDSMSEDKDLQSLLPPKRHAVALARIAEVLNRFGYTLEDYALPSGDASVIDELQNRDLRRELDFDVVVDRPC